MSEFDYTFEERQRYINAGLYIPFYIETPIGDADIVIGAEAADVIEVSIQVVDPGGDAIEEAMVLTVTACSDAVGTTPAATSGGIAATTGAVLNELAVDTSYQIVTDEFGLAVIEVTEVAAKDVYLGIILPGGKYIVTEALSFA
jgi:hypothetical protein